MLSSSSLRPVEFNPQPTTVERQVAPAEPDQDELKALREQLRQMQVTIALSQEEKARLRRELEQKNAATPPAALSSVANEKFTCNICQERKIEVICLPCRHMFCEPCSNDLKGKPCHHCKQTAENVERLFFAY